MEKRNEKNKIPALKHKRQQYDVETISSAEKRYLEFQ